MLRTKTMIRTALWILSATLLLPSFLFPGDPGKILYHADYEEGKILDEDTYGIRVEKCCEHSVNVVDTVARKGKRSVRFESRRDDPLVANSPGRAELKVKRTKPIVEEWYAWSIYTSKEMKPDIDEILGQWHASPDFDEGAAVGLARGRRKEREGPTSTCRRSGPRTGRGPESRCLRRSSGHAERACSQGDPAAHHRPWSPGTSACEDTTAGGRPDTCKTTGSRNG